MLETAVDIVRGRQLGMQVPAAALGYARAMCGQLPIGLPSKHFGRVAMVSAWLGHAYAMAGRLADATDVAQRALALARHHHQRGTEAWTLRLLGEIAAHRMLKDAAGAEDYYRRALVQAEELGMRPLIARCYLELGGLYQQAARRSDAEEYLTRARTMLAEMGMRFWLEQVEAEGDTTVQRRRP